MDTRINVGIKKEIINKFKILAVKLDRPRKELIEEALENYLKLKSK